MISTFHQIKSQNGKETSCELCPEMDTKRKEVTETTPMMLFFRISMNRIWIKSTITSPEKENNLFKGTFPKKNKKRLNCKLENSRTSSKRYPQKPQNPRISTFFNLNTITWCISWNNKKKLFLTQKEDVWRDLS